MFPSFAKFISTVALVSCIGLSLSQLVEVRSRAESQVVTFRTFSVMGKGMPAVKRGPATIVLQDGYDLPAVYDRARPSGNSRPTTLATADFDVDGFPDLVSGFATADGGYVVIQRGNPESFAPTRPENVQAVNESRFPVTFLPQTKLIEITDSPDFIAVGDFNRDHDIDLITAKRGGTELNLLTGNGKGDFTSTGKIALPGRVTTLAFGQIDQNDTFNDLVVGVEADAASLLVFEDAKTGVYGSPARYELPAAAQAVILAEMDGTIWKDAAILAGGDVFILHGRNQSEVESAKQAALRLEHIDLPFTARAMTVGEFIWDRDGRRELALLRDDGAVTFAAMGELDTRPFSISEVRDRRRRQNPPVGDPERLAGPTNVWRQDASTKWQVAEDLAVIEPAAVNSVGENSSATLFAAQLSGQAADDLVVVDGATRQLKIFAVEAPAKNGDEYVSHAGPRAEMALQTGETPVAALSIRTSLFVRAGLVFLKEGDDSPEIIPAAPSATFIVTKIADTNDGTCSVADCSLREAHVAANGAAGADMITVPAGTYTKTIVGNDDGAAMGDLDVTQSATISGDAAVTTIIQSGTTNANGIDKTFGFNPLCDPAVSGTVNNVTVRFGNNPHPDGSPNFEHTGGGLDYCGASATTIAITNSTFDQNTVNNSYGGGINLDSLAPSTSNQQITNCAITNNDTVNAGEAGGGGVNIFGDQSVVTITGTTISGNRARLTGTDGRGGGVRARLTNGGSVTINTSTISNNNASSSGGGIANVPSSGAQSFSMSNSSVTGNTSNGNGVGSRAEGGGFYNNSLSSGTINITESTFTGNTATLAPTGGTHIGGGGLAFGANNAAATLSFSRIVNNVATSGNGARKDNNAGTVTATNNWWGCSTGPAAAPCDTAVLQAAPGVLTTSPFLRMTNTAALTTLVQGQATTITASFLTNSSGGAISTTNLDTIIGLPITFNNPALGTLSGAQTTIQGTGTATVTFTSNTAGATGKADAIVDNGTTVTSPLITVTNTATWDGSASSDWNNATNWTTNFVPGTTNSVDLPAAGVTNQANLSAANATVANLTVGANRSLTISGGRTLTVNGALAMNGNNIDTTAGTLEIGGAGTVSRTSGVVLGNMRKVVTSAPLPAEAPLFVFTYPVGTATGFSPVTANFTAGSGSLTVAAVGGLAPSTPALNAATTLNRHWLMTETGALTASMTFNYLAGDVAGTETNYVMIRATPGAAPVRFANVAPCPGAGSPCVNTAANTIFVAGVESFANAWTAGEPLAPTAANVSVSGRVLAANGRGVSNAVVSLIGINGVSKTARTSSFGYYRFEDVRVGETYVISVDSKRYRFAPRTINIADELADLDFLAEP